MGRTLHRLLSVVVCTLIAMLTGPAASAQSGWSIQQTLDGYEEVYAIEFVDMNTGWAAIAGPAAIFHTEDGGQTWSEQTLPPEVFDRIYSFFFLDENMGWAALGSGQLLHTNDGGENWTIQHTADSYLLKPFFVSEDTGWVFGGEGLILHTTDGGETWSDQSTGPWDFNDAWFFDENTGIAVGFTGAAVRTTNGGDTWTEVDPDVGVSVNNLSALFFVDDQTGWAAGGEDINGEGILLKTDDGGQTWELARQDPDVFDFRDIHFVDEDQGWTVGSNSDFEGGGTYILHTEDGGETWTRQYSGTDRTGVSTPALWFETADRGWIGGGFFGSSTVGSEAFILSTDNGGRTEVAISSPSANATVEPDGIIVQYSAAGFVLDCPPDGSVENQFGHGHAHILVDGVLVAESCSGEAEIPGALGDGAHTITVELVNNDHSALTPAVTASVDVSVSTAMPAIDIVWPADGMTIPPGVPSIKVEVSDFTLDCDASGGAPEQGTGHYHVEIDGSLDAQACLAMPALTTELEPGSHTITVKLVGNDHAPLDPSVEETITVEVADVDSTNWVPSSVATGIARTAGAVGSLFRSTLWLTAADSESSLRIHFVPSTGQPQADFPTAYLTIPAGESIVFADALRDGFGVTAGTFGNVVISVAEGSSTPIVSARTFNDQREANEGTFGQFITGIDLADASAAPVQINGLASSDAFRSNVGIINHDPANGIEASITIVDSTGQVVGDPIIVQVEPGSLRQINGVGAGLDLDPFSAVISAAGPFSAYVSKLDNVTSDPIFITDNSTTSTTQWIDGIGSVQGAGGTFFRSELSLTNLTLNETVATLAIVPRGATTPTGTVDVTLAPAESRLYSDVIEEAFELQGVAGTIWISSAGAVSAWARTYNDLTVGGGAGTFGQFIPAFDETDLIGMSGAVLPGLSQNEAFRTNAGIVNVGMVDASVTLSVWSSEGAKLGEKAYGVPAGSAMFVGQVINDLGVEALSDGYIRIMPSVGSAFYVWASSVDNVSTDQTFFRPFNLD
ncbi:MAG: YCF48-related protein [Thermoanaerobaculia bacterium]|nr:YCF48-related protein [Thermoanaerobaculia bacterium]